MRLNLALALGLVWFSLGAAQPPQPAAQNVQQQAERIERGRPPAADAIHDVGADEDKGCDSPQDKRSSDLCAQWKAADAATNAARATWAAVLLSFFGTVLIAATFAETYRTSRRQLRAYVALMDYKVIPLEFLNGGSGKINLGFQNYGQTPAIGVATVISYGFRNWTGKLQKPDMWDYVGDRLPVDLAPTGAPLGRVISFREHGLAYLEELWEGDVALYVEICTSYADIFGVQHEQTTVLYTRGNLYRAHDLKVMEQSREKTTRGKNA